MHADNHGWSRRDLGVFLVILLTAGLCASVGATRLLWVADYRGARDGIRLLGLVAGVGAGAISWRALKRDETVILGLVATVATVAIVASVPTALDQTTHLLRLYGGMTATQAERQGAVQIVGAGHEHVFDDLRAAIPAR
jgi:hypothetical protein